MNWDEHNEKKRKDKADHLQASLDVLHEARKLALENGFELIQHNHWHFSLNLYKGGERKWRLNIYPSNRRIWWDKKCGKAPFLDLPFGWTLLDIVKITVKLL